MSLIVKALKITNLLAQFLYLNKRLDLPGIGTFILDPSAVIETEKGKQNKSPLLEGVTFEDNRSAREDEKLIAYISEQSGKIKALASADLNSHLELARQFLNIGKPFLFEGIGSLVKKQSGELSFTPGHVLADKMDHTVSREYGKEAVPEEADSDYKSVFYAKSDKAAWKKPAVIALILAGFLLAIWGGYTVYKNRTSGENDEVVKEEKGPAQKDAVQTFKDTVQQNITNAQDTIKKPGNTAATAGYKIILETSPKTRAYYRYGRLKTFQWPVQMETKDSTLFTIYMTLTLTPADTTRMLDSLSRLNGKRVYISQ
ncbi:MAG TPA: hypothetical protein VFV31_15730 [Chitinophagaceae bacterium]|nr:hypothetical protein [Chitinophagaceae bacterium]